MHISASQVDIMWIEVHKTWKMRSIWFIADAINNVINKKSRLAVCPVTRKNYFVGGVPSPDTEENHCIDDDDGEHEDNARVLCTQSLDSKKLELKCRKILSARTSNGSLLRDTCSTMATRVCGRAGMAAARGAAAMATFMSWLGQVMPIKRRHITTVIVNQLSVAPNVERRAGERAQNSLKGANWCQKLTHLGLIHRNQSRCHEASWYVLLTLERTLWQTPSQKPQDHLWSDQFQIIIPLWVHTCWTQPERQGLTWPSRWDRRNGIARSTRRWICSTLFSGKDGHLVASIITK